MRKKGKAKSGDDSGKRNDEASPLRVALAFEQATKWHTMHPKVDWA